MFDWNDLRVFLAAARTTSLAAAAARLSVDASTVGRRLTRLEGALGTTLFLRSPGGLRLTAAGRALLETAQEAEAAMVAIARAGPPDSASGTVRISTAEGFGVAIIAPALPSLLASRPGIKIELAAQSGFLSPSKREADIAVTLSPPTSTRVVCEPLTTYELGLYASPQYLEQSGAPISLADLRGRPIVGYIDELLYAPELRYLDEILPDLQPSLCSSSIRAQREIIAAGGGVGVLPCFLAEGLTRLFSAEVRLRRRFWISANHDAAETTRVQIVKGWLHALATAKASDLNPL